MRTKLLLGYGLLGVSLLFIGCVVTSERPADSAPPTPPPAPTQPVPTAAASTTAEPVPTTTATAEPTATATASASTTADAGPPPLPEKPPIRAKGKGITPKSEDGGT